MRLNDVHNIYFIGIGGIGMSALARYFHDRGVSVAGYDRTETALTRELAAAGMDVRYREDVDSLPKDVDLVVYTPAVPETHAELQYFRARETPLMKRSEVLGLISGGMKTIAIAGTHGKTTTTTLVTHLLRTGGIDCSAFMGGIAGNYGTNFLSGKSDWVVVEADEYDRSFLQLHPDVAVILSMDADHLDIYGSHENLLQTGFLPFAQRVKPGGMLLVRYDLAPQMVDARSVDTYGIEGGAYHADNIRVEDGWFVFDYYGPEYRLEDLRLGLPGRHNVENATAAMTVALKLGVSSAAIREGLANFKGVGRRFEYIIRQGDLVYIDDYAHHPAELAATIEAARQLYPERRLTGIFQPHLYTRTRDFADGFAQALDKLDEAYVMDIYPAREIPIEGISADTILDKMSLTRRQRLPREQVLDTLAAQPPEVLLTMGAGDIDTLVEPIRRRLSKAD